VEEPLLARSKLNFGSIDVEESHIQLTNIKALTSAPTWHPPKAAGDWLLGPSS
jgi:hypothetical protein